MHHFDHVLDLVDMFVDESVMQETMAVVKPSAVLYSNIIVKELFENDFGFTIPGIVGENADQDVSECRLGEDGVNTHRHIVGQERKRQTIVAAGMCDLKMGFVHLQGGEGGEGVKGGGPGRPQGEGGHPSRDSQYNLNIGWLFIL